MATKKNTTAKAAPKSQEQHTPRISVRIDKMLDSAASSTRAFASANIAGAYAIHGIRVVDSQKGLFVSMPQNSYTTENGETRYSDAWQTYGLQDFSVAAYKAYRSAYRGEDSRREIFHAHLCGRELDGEGIGQDSGPMMGM